MADPVAVYLIHAERDASPAKYIVNALRRHNWYAWSRATAPRRDILHAEDILKTARAAVVLGTRSAAISRLAELDLKRALEADLPVLLVTFDPEGGQLKLRIPYEPLRVDVRHVGLDGVAKHVIAALAPLVDRPGFAVPAAPAGPVERWWRSMWYRPPPIA
jgi:hypothetical protein